METKATSIKLTITDKAVIAAVRERHGLDSTAAAIRFGLTAALSSVPLKEYTRPKNKSKKSKKTG